jgi:mono/diheme cytochrome c family protein
MRRSTRIAGLTGLALLSVSVLTGGDAPPTVRDPQGRSITIEAPPGGVLALVFYSTECPISNAYSPALNELAATFPGGRLRLIGLCVDPGLDDRTLARHAEEYRLAFPVARDRSLRLARRYGVKVTPEAVVLDDAGRVRYRGRIDDQFAARQKRNANPRSNELQDAIAALLDGRPVDRAEVEAVGCPLPLVPEKHGPDVTFARDVAPLLQRHCQDCHRPGQVGPFPLVSYEDAAKRADDLANLVSDRIMPPWKPTPGFGPRLAHDRSMSDAEIARIVAWAEAGAPKGDPADMPPPREFGGDWALGTPDLILEAPEDFAIPAGGDDIYRCFVIPTNLPDDVAISAIEYRPGNRRVVHHVLSYVDTTGEARKKDQAEPGPGYTCFSGPGVPIHGDLGGWAPGNEPSRLPEGIGRSLPKGADVVMQVHYHPSGKPEKDRTRMGLYFCKKPVRQTLHWAAAWNDKLVLPPGESYVEIRASWRVPVDVEAHAVTPHMHRLGRDIKMTVTDPEGRTRGLVEIASWDFGWQNTYYFAEPLLLRAGSRIDVVAHYDNSEANPSNPNHPPKEVRWGEATTDEMCIGFIALTKHGQDLTRGDADDLREIIDRSYERHEDGTPRAEGR